MRLGPSFVALCVAALAASTVPAWADSEGRSSSSARVVFGRFATTYAFDPAHKGRASNIEIAADAIDGKTIAPRGTFSFNDAVGERTAAFGYAKAVVIRDGMIAEGTGGGACQVASTLHAAALLANLDVVKRTPHTRPSAYIRMGLDATVSFGGTVPAIDLKLANPMPSSVMIHARAHKGNLEVWFDATDTDRPDVLVTSEILETMRYPRIYERDSSLGDDDARRKTFGIPGFRVKRTREARLVDGTVQRDVRIDVYLPTTEVVRIAPGLDPTRLRDGGSEAPVLVPDPGAVPPAIVQLRPSILVTLDNKDPAHATAP